MGDYSVTKDKRNNYLDENMKLLSHDVKGEKLNEILTLFYAV